MRELSHIEESIIPFIVMPPYVVIEKLKSFIEEVDSMVLSQARVYGYELELSSVEEFVSCLKVVYRQCSLDMSYRSHILFQVALKAAIKIRYGNLIYSDRIDENIIIFMQQYFVRRPEVGADRNAIPVEFASRRENILRKSGPYIERLVRSYPFMEQ